MQHIVDVEKKEHLKVKDIAEKDGEDYYNGSEVPVPPVEAEFRDLPSLSVNGGGGHNGRAEDDEEGLVDEDVDDAKVDGKGWTDTGFGSSNFFHLFFPPLCLQTSSRSASRLPT